MRLYTKFFKTLLPLGFSMVLIVCSLSSCQKMLSTNNLSSEKLEVDSAFEVFTNQLFFDEITSNTINLHYCVENPAALGITDYEISLGDFSKEARESSSDYLRDTLSEVLSFDYEKLSLENQLTYDILVDYLNTQLTLCKYDLYQEPLAFSGGLQMELPILFAEYKFTKEQDVKDYLELIALTDEYFNQIIEFEAEKSSNNIFMSPDLCQRVIDSCHNFLMNKENHYLLSSFSSKLETLDISDSKKTSYIRQNQAILEKQLFPAYKQLIDELNKLKNTGTNSLGISYLENGKKYYESLVFSETGCNESIDAIFRRIDNQRMHDLLICSQLQAENQNLIEKCSNLKLEMSTPDSMLNLLQTAILEKFPEPPNCSYEINYVDPSLEDYLAPAFYIVAPIDNYTENIIYINNNHISSDIYAFTTLAHEGYPGHLYQTVMTYTYGYPWVRSILNFGGYVEGWATYIEMMAYDYAGLEKDVASFLSHNQAASLSLYASSDIGLHYYGWSMEEMINFWAGFGITNESTIKEITQLILSEPGNYLKYYIGYIEFLELKDYAKELFGKDYSDKAFHKAVLDIGPASFSILEKYLPKYYSSQN